MKKMFIFLFITSFSVLFAFQDYGEVGKLYNIEEQNIQEEFEAKIKQINKKSLVEYYEKSINAAFITHVTLPASKVDSVLVYQDYIIAPFDVPDPSSPGDLLFRKGDMIISDIGSQEAHLCFIDGSNKTIAKAIYQEFKECDYMVANADIRNVDYLEGNEVFPMHQVYLTRFHIEKLPVKLTMTHDEIKAQYLSIPRIIENLKVGNSL